MRDDAERPAAPADAAVVPGLYWGIRESFVRYVLANPDGEMFGADGVETDGDGTFRFPLHAVARGDDGWSIEFAGEVVFTAHGGMLGVRIARPALDLRGDGGTLSVSRGEERVTIARVRAARPVAVSGAWLVFPPLSAEPTRPRRRPVRRRLPGGRAARPAADRAAARRRAGGRAGGMSGGSTGASTMMHNMDFAQPHTRSRRLPRPHSGGGPQHLLITLLGDYWFAREELLPSAALVELLGEFGANENASRQAMRRLTQRGLLAQGKQGRTTSYGIPREIVASQRLRLARAVTFGADFADWDGRWTIVSFSIPESERDVRRVLRNGLRNMAFGDLQDGVWITPHDRQDDAVALLDELEVAEGHVMRATWRMRAGDEAAIAGAFGLDELAGRYEDFVAQYEPRLAWARGTVDPREALVLRTQLTNDWLAFRLDDPELPASLLPDDWPRPRARDAFLALYDALGPAAARHVRQVVARYDEPLSRIVTYNATPHFGQALTPELARSADEDRRRGLRR
ncbi:PaaX family transcriptional regulator C-terminal domain-containing protein [Microbacterium sp. Marseille-Q6965]|uniref:PaaX family transcriptional regulator C-terminal domain-containing protein n=1 Tax=Microbacterium sp. Marseille-Q6965 TaxID=2965072 RepID=UPI0021B7B457|nr:PaaX family transcriptional regulator C-terminal domain-containing protein [Microbacterium sp. Marseille-Q6965]